MSHATIFRNSEYEQCNVNGNVCKYNISIISSVRVRPVKKKTSTYLETKKCLTISGNKHFPFGRGLKKTVFQFYNFGKTTLITRETISCLHVY